MSSVCHWTIFVGSPSPGLRLSQLCLVQWRQEVYEEWWKDKLYLGAFA